MKKTLLKAILISSTLMPSLALAAIPGAGLGAIEMQHLIGYKTFVLKECGSVLEDNSGWIISKANKVRVKGENKASFEKDLANYVIDATDCKDLAGAAKMALSSNLLNSSYPESMKALKAAK